MYGKISPVPDNHRSTHRSDRIVFERGDHLMFAPLASPGDSPSGARRTEIWAQSQPNHVDAAEHRPVVAAYQCRRSMRWLRMFEQNFRADKWNLCQGYAASRIGGFVK